MNTNEFAQIFESNTENFMIPDSHPAFEASNGENYYFEMVDVSLIKGLFSELSNMEDWFLSEVNIWDSEHDCEEEGNRWLELEKYYLSASEELPINLYEGSDGFYYLDDGHHRLAIAIKNHWNKIPAIVKKV